MTPLSNIEERLGKRGYRSTPVYVHKPELACPCSYRIPDVGQPSPALCPHCGKATMERRA